MSEQVSWRRADSCRHFTVQILVVVTWEHTSVLSTAILWVQIFEVHAGILCRELPISRRAFCSLAMTDNNNVDRVLGAE